MKKYYYAILAFCLILFMISVQNSSVGYPSDNNTGFFKSQEQVNIPGKEFDLDFRLVETGEMITFRLTGSTPGDRFEIFPRYLEKCDPHLARQSTFPLEWLDYLDKVSLPPEDTIRYIPEVPGNYIARWTSKRYGVEYRYFAVIDQSYLIYRPVIWDWPEPFPSTGIAVLHNGGLPFDWIVSKNRDDRFIDRLVKEQQYFGGGIIYAMTENWQDTTSGEMLKTLIDNKNILDQKGLDAGRAANLWYGGGLSNNKVWLARKAGFEIIDGYVPRASNCGLGAPYYPFFIGSTDYRFPGQDGPTNAISCIFDFVGSWHFHGPVGFHRPSAKGNWEYARYYIDLAAREAVLTAKNSRIHNFVSTLINYESPVDWGDKPYQLIWDEERGIKFFENYLYLLAFEHARKWPIVFARAADYADYFRSHYQEMPRRIISSITHNIGYDKFWTDEWHEQQLIPAGYVPFNQSLKDFKENRIMPQYNMPVSLEFINYNDNQRTCRFEYACPKPLHYYDLTGLTSWQENPREYDLPDPDIRITAISGNNSYEVNFTITSESEFKDYLLAIWNIPKEYKDCPFETNAVEFIPVENTDGDLRGIIRFDLKTKCSVKIKWHRNY